MTSSIAEGRSLPNMANMAGTEALASGFKAPPAILDHVKTPTKTINRLIKRDGNLCWLCGHSIRKMVGKSHPLKATADHVLAKKDGGTRALSNLKLAHKFCNEKRHWLPALFSKGYQEYQIKRYNDALREESA